MPLQSREVVTLSLILDCDEEEDEHIATEESQRSPPLLRLPVELRLKVLRYLLRFDRNRKTYTRRPPSTSASELLYLNPRRILEAAPFRHKGNQDINGSPPVINTCHLDLAILKTCKSLYWEAKTVLYIENKVVGFQSGIKGLGAKFQNYGLPVWGPFPASRLITSQSEGSESDMSKFDPVMLFSGQNTKPDTPFYLCSYADTADFVHALWIMIESPFARGMRYNLTLPAEPRYRHVNRTDSFVKCAVLPWLHSHVKSIDFHYPGRATTSNDTAQITSPSAEKRLDSIRNEFINHRNKAKYEPNVHTYNSICTYLEQLMLQADVCIEKGDFFSAERLYERVCYESSSIVRTRTSKLVDVSSKSKEGINRVCKLIALSAYRLCELRSGSLALLLSKTIEEMFAKGKKKASCEAKRAENCSPDQASADERSEPVEASSSATANEHLNVEHIEQNTTQSGDEMAVSPGERNAAKAVMLRPASASYTPRTTRLEPSLAQELAITSGLLALRLPCACPVSEWYARLNIMLLRLFAERNDVTYAVSCIRQIQNYCNIVLKDAKTKNQKDPKWQALESLVTDLTYQLKPGAPRRCFLETADRCQEVIKSLWGPRLNVQKDYVGLIWTFRWAT
ncbi:uncharacterized protein Z518_03313 [Rhinocladiella mackenziei CBS 650.93]|uniref:Uncharacterized protein n=1 Tax=Rhinocladiella mackenziei CBS 650.93 TaxID=1442369 RepID=A0A0D2IZ30_9EURO|nr:uncharacterized protein Z518_03313 [Rhinocladiella mackenziei CBS 650.93]KIX08656.1 hypothetical protein Z518_03313 [Rhinocladiella mackenziei CBS 650.93]